MTACSAKCLTYLENAQQPDGSWIPLWFGNEAHPNKLNPCYGTAMVLDSLNRLRDEYRKSPLHRMSEKAESWLWSNRNDDGSWGGFKGLPGTREETALAITALATENTAKSDLLEASAQWLIAHRDAPPAPIGLYFASLWYHEKLYPEIFTLKALKAVQRLG